MAVAGNAPAIFKRCNKGGVPYYAVLASAAFSPLAYLSAGDTSAVVFNWLVSILNTAGFISWVMCCVIFFRFRAACAAQGVGKDKLPYTSVWQPYGAWVAFVAFSLFGLLNGFGVFFPGHWSVSGFFTAYIGFPVFLIIYLGHKLSAGRGESWWRSASAIDLISGLAEVRVAEEAEEAERLAREGEEKGDAIPVWQKPFRAVFGALFN